MSETISRDDLLQFTHQLNCKLYGAKGIKLTGLPALNEIENILFFRFIEERKEIKLDDDIKFSAICKKYATDEKIKEDKKIPNIGDRNCFKLWDEFYNKENNNCIIGQYFNNEVINKYISSSVSRVSAFTDKNRSSLSSTLQELFNMVYNKFKNIKFDSSFYDMFGAAHEEFKTNAHGNGGKHTGQHFTPMDIKRLVSEELNVKSNEIYYEPCAGTGGFIHTIDKYVREKEGEKASKKFKKNIYANECNPEITKPLMINMLLHDIPVDNIHERDSLCNENCELMKEKADVIGTNYPFGMSNNIDLNDYYDKKYWGCLVRNKNVIKNSTGQFILHIYHSLKKDGRAGFVSDRGIINNGDDSSWEKEIRKFMIKNTNLYKIWLLPNGVFPYTNFATCVIFIKKGEETKKVEIYEGKFKDAKNKTGLYIEEKPVKTFTIKELGDNGYSLKMEEKVEKIKKGWVKLGDVVEYIKYKTKDSSVISSSGKYRYYSSSIIDYQLTNEFTNDEECLIINKTNGSGKAKIFYNPNETKFCASSATIIYKFKKLISLRFGYYFMLLSIYNIEKLYTGSDKKSLNISNFETFQIPSLSLQHQQEIVDFLDAQFELYDINLLAKQIKDMPLFNLLINKKYDLFADALHLIYRKMELDALHLIYRKMELDALHIKMDKDKKAVFNIRVNGLDCKEYKLGDIVEIKGNGKYSLKDLDEKGKYDYYSASKTNPTGKINEYCFDGEEYLLFIKSGGNKDNLYSDTGLGKVYICKNKTAGNPAVLKMEIKNNKFNINYIALYMNYNAYTSRTFAVFNAGNGNIRMPEYLEGFNIQIPSLQEQEKIIKDIEKIESTQSTYADYAKSIQTQIESINKVIENLTKLNKEIDDDNSDDNTSESEEEKVEVKPIKKVKKQIKQESSESDSDNKLNNKSDSSDKSTEENAKTKKKIIPVKKIEISDSEKPKKKPKPVKKAESSSESESDNNSDSSESEENTKPKKIVKPVKKIELSDSEKPNKKQKPIKKIESSSSESDSSDSLSESEIEDANLKSKKNIKKNK
jgi:type I restriction-modification system DNA methylase subunit